MDPNLYKAALTGNPDLFIQNPTKPLNQSDLLALTTDTHDNILHIAAQNDHLSFISQVMETSLLQPHQKILLICQQNARNGRNPLHIAASRGHLQIVKLLIESYNSLSKLVISDEIKNNNVETRLEIRVSFGKMEDNDDCPYPPWIARSAPYGETPLNTAIKCKHEEVAALILEQDLEKLCSMDDFEGKSPVYDAVQNGVESIALKILESDCCYSLGRQVYNNKTLLHGVSDITEQVAIKLLQKHPELFKTSDSRGETFLHEWAHRGELASLQCLLKDKVFSNWSADYKYLLCLRNNFGNNPLHCAIYSNKVEVLKLLIDTYRQLFDPNGGQLHEFPWLHQNYREETPLHLAIERGGEDIVLYLLSLDSRLAGIPNFQGKSPLFLAVECGRANIVQEILYHGTGPFLLGGPKGKNPLHIASKCPGIAGFLVEILGADVMDMKDDGKAPLDAAAEAGDIELMNMVMGHSGITSAPYAWVGACKAGHLDAFLAFMNHAGDFRQLCSEQRDTPLHHFKFKSKEEYQKVLEIPLMGQLKNATDSEGATPLHRAIERKDIVFVELLLGTHGIDWTIKDNAGQTPMDLLGKLCDELPDWDAMCKRIDMNPRIKTTYIPLKTNLAEVRTTLSVVAALLATITFAAGFTIPGGYNDDGYVILAKKAAFIVFLLSDTYAMCCSMLVLFCLIWAMVCDPDKALVLVDGSVFLLQQSLYGTLVAFMSGVYTVVSRDCLWTAIVVCVMCSLVAVAANKSVLYRLLNKFMPSAR